MFCANSDELAGRPRVAPTGFMLFAISDQHGSQLFLAEAVDEAFALDEEGEIDVVAVAGVQEGLHICLALGDDHIRPLYGGFQLGACQLQHGAGDAGAVVDDREGDPGGLGIGGGSLLILWLTMVLGMDQTAARSINLLFFIPSALVACLFRYKQGKLDIRKVLPAIVAGCIAAACFSWLSVRLELEVLKKLFGVLLLFTGIRELLYRPRKAR